MCDYSLEHMAQLCENRTSVTDVLPTELQQRAPFTRGVDASARTPGHPNTSAGSALLHFRRPEHIRQELCHVLQTVVAHGAAL